MCPQRVESLFPPFRGAPAIKLCWPSKSNALWFLLLMPEPQSWESDEGLKILSPVGECLQYSLQFFDHSLGGKGFDYIMGASVYHLLLVSSLCLSMYLIFLIGSRFFFFQQLAVI